MAKFVLAAAAEGAVGASAEHLTLSLLCQVLVILLVTRLTVWVSTKFFKQTDVAGEILAGLLLGPSVLGALSPSLHAAVFDKAVTPVFIGVAQVGLILLMFQIGLEFEFKRNLGKELPRVVVLSLAGILVPFALGYMTAPWFWQSFAEPRPVLLGFRLFFAIAVSITAIPILGRIFIELGLSHTRVASLTIAAAAIDDVAGWTLLGLVSAVVSANFALGPFGLRVVGLTAFVAFVMIVVRPLARRWVAQRELTNRTVNVILLLLLGSAVVTSALGVFAIIGGFIIGMALHDQRDFVAAWRFRIEPLVYTFFLPLFFAYTGLRTNVGFLGSSDGLMRCAAVIGIAFAGKFGAAYIATRVFGASRRESATAGICMNTRGLMELVVVNVGHDLGVLPNEMFTSLVLMAIVSTFIATPCIAWLERDQRRAPPEVPNLRGTPVAPVGLEPDVSEV